MEVPGVVLPRPYPTAVEAVAAQIVVEPARNVVAAPAHEIHLVPGDRQTLQRADLLHELLGETCRIYSVVPVGEAVPYAGAREIVYDRAAHRELVEVVIGEMGDNLAHYVVFCP